MCDTAFYDIIDYKTPKYIAPLIHSVIELS